MATSVAAGQRSAVVPDPRDSTPPLASLAPLLAEEPALRAVIARQPTVAVPDAAAGRCSWRRWPASRPAGRCCSRCRPAPRPSASSRDLAQFLGDGEVELFPAWETLPFERVSPSFETMGRRLRVMWRLRAAGTPPAVVVAPVRALVQRLGPHVEDVEPVVVKPGDQVDRDELVARLVAGGYRREYQVEARGEVAVRGSIVDVYPSTDDHPVRIDLWGDEVDRLSAFSVADQRSHARRRRGRASSRRASCCPPTTCASAPPRCCRAAAVGPRAVGAAGRGPAVRRHGVVAAVAHRPRAPAHRPAARRRAVLLVEPKRMRDRAQELLDEEASLASTLAVTWGAGGERDLPASRSSSTGCSRTPAPARCRCCRRPTGPTPRASPRARSIPSSATPTRSARRLRALAGEGYRVVLAAEGTGSAQRLRDILAGEGVDADRASRRPARSGCWSRRSSAASCSRARSSRSSPKPTSPVVDACTVARAWRASRHRLLRRARTGRLRRALPARRRPLPGDEAAHDGRRRARLPLARVQGRQGLRAHRPGGVRAQVHRRRDAVAQPHGRRRLREAAGAGAQRGARDRRGARRALPAAAGDARPRLRRPTRRGSTRWRRRSRSRRRPTSCRPSST